MSLDEQIDPVYKYIDDKIEALKQDLLFNEIYELKDAVDQTRRLLFDTRVETNSATIHLIVLKYDENKRIDHETALSFLSDLDSANSYFSGRIFEEGSDSKKAYQEWFERVGRAIDEHFKDFSEDLREIMLPSDDLGLSSF